MPDDSAPYRTPVQELIGRCQQASERMSVRNPNRALLQEMAVALVALTKMNVALHQQLADKPRIVLP